MIAIDQRHPNDIALQLTGRDYISFSAIATYQTCPLRYYFRYVANLPEETISAGLIFGRSIHAAIEHHYRELLAGYSPPDLELLLAAFWGEWNAATETAEVQFAKGETAGAMGQLAERVLRTFQSSELASPAGAILGIEEELRNAVIPGLPELLARIDLVTETEHELIVTDFKTSRSRWSSTQAEDAGEQLLLYSELASQIVPGKPLRLEFAVLTKAKEPIVERFPVAVDRHRIARTKRIVERVWRAIEAGHFYPAPSPLNCPGCPFRKPCRAWAD